MAEPTNPRYLLGGGEKLSSEIGRPPRGMGDKANPYGFAEARTCLGSQWAQVGDALAALPPGALPAGQAVVVLTLHPS
ncbi:MAG TPA: hypothetical protein PLH31_13645, partial [Caulobacter sp.]|nr:hypothetical protein [Caulobacter sp.]